MLSVKENVFCIDLSNRQQGNICKTHTLVDGILRCPGIDSVCLCSGSRSTTFSLSKRKASMTTFPISLSLSFPLSPSLRRRRQPTWKSPMQQRNFQHFPSSPLTSHVSLTTFSITLQAGSTTTAMHLGFFSAYFWKRELFQQGDLQSI